MNSIGLAPMEGVTCFATRLWFFLAARPQFMMTPFLRLTPEFPWKRMSETFCPEVLLYKNKLPYTLIPQLMGPHPEDIVRFGSHFLKFTDFIDVNCGCPSPKVVGHCAGSALLEKVNVFSYFITSLEEQLGKKCFSIKMRLGFHSDAEFPALLDALSLVSPARVTIHGRTRSDRYTGKARWAPMREASALNKFPVFGSGDIVDGASYAKSQEAAPQVAGVIIGRGALRNPWIFEEIREQRAVSLSSSTLLVALGTFTLLQDALAQNPKILFQAIEDDVFSLFCATDLSLWEKVYCYFSEKLYAKFVPLEELEVNKPTFARTKMLWNSLRSSLPAKFLEPTLLRSANFKDFYHHFKFLLEGEEIFTLQHNPALDWIYSGEKNEQR